MRVDLLPSPAKRRGIQIMGTYFHSKNFQGPKLHITVYTFAKAREKVILCTWFEFLNFLVAAFLNLLDFNNSVIFFYLKNMIEQWHYFTKTFSFFFLWWVWYPRLFAGRGVTEAVSAVGFCLGSGLFGSCNSD